jgi:hypothetical protein
MLKCHMCVAIQATYNKFTMKSNSIRKIFEGKKMRLENLTRGGERERIGKKFKRTRGKHNRRKFVSFEFQIEYFLHSKERECGKVKEGFLTVTYAPFSSSSCC